MPASLDPNLRVTYLAELRDRILDFSAAWPVFVAECRQFDLVNVVREGQGLAPAAELNQWRIRKFAADLLITAAQIARILDPHPSRGNQATRDRCVARGQSLREELGVPSDSPLLDRDLRNALEHIDEYIDAWVSQNPARPLETWAFATTGAADAAALEQTIRRIYIRTYDVVVLGARANLGRLHEAVRALATRLPGVHASQLLVRFDSPETGQSDVIITQRVHNAGERGPPDDLPTG